MQPSGICALLVAATATASSATFSTLTEGTTINGFRRLSHNLEGADHPLAARCQHVNTGYTLDLIELQSVPQSIVNVNTYTTSDRGEPHTQEHLLVGKGNKGR